MNNYKTNQKKKTKDFSIPKGHKKCTKCNKIKLDDEFYVVGYIRRSARCKVCKREYQKAHQKNNY